MRPAGAIAGCRSRYPGSPRLVRTATPHDHVAAQIPVVAREDIHACRACQGPGQHPRPPRLAAHCGPSIRRRSAASTPSGAAPRPSARICARATIRAGCSASRRSASWEPWRMRHAMHRPAWGTAGIGTPALSAIASTPHAGCASSAAPRRPSRRPGASGPRRWSGTTGQPCRRPLHLPVRRSSGVGAMAAQTHMPTIHATRHTVPSHGGNPDTNGVLITLLPARHAQRYRER